VSSFVGYLVAGIANGSIYALIAISASLVFKASRVANLAIGETGTFSAFVMYAVVVQAGLSYAVGVVAALVVGAALSVAVESIVVRYAAGATLVIVGTLGVSDVLSGADTVKWAGHEPYQAPAPPHPATFHVSGVPVPGQYTVIVLVLAVLGAALYLLLERTAFGTTLRACAEDRDLAAMAGVRVRLRVVLMWALSGAIVVVAALLVAPLSALSVSLMSALLFKGYAAAILGGMDNLVGAATGGIVLGIGEALIGGFISSTSQDAILFAVVVVLLAARPNGLLARKVFARV
jgi:branched-chain amino acid transport system permease protein